MSDRFAQLERSLTNQKPNEEQVERIVDLRGDAIALGALILGSTTPSREQSLALTSLEETVMWAVKAIVLEES